VGSLGVGTAQTREIGSVVERKDGGWMMKGAGWGMEDAGCRMQDRAFRATAPEDADP